MLAELPFLEGSTKGGDVNYTNLKKKKQLTGLCLASKTEISLSRFTGGNFPDNSSGFKNSCLSLLPFEAYLLGLPQFR